MKRITVLLTNSQIKKLALNAKLTGTNQRKIISRCVDEALRGTEFIRPKRRVDAAMKAMSR